MRALRIVLFATALTGASCGDSVVSPSDSGNGILNLFLTDSPYSDAKALLVTFSEVTAHRAGEGGFTRIPFGDATSLMRTCDLKRLQNVQDLLGVGTLAAGHYTQLRVVVAGAALYFDNPSTSATPCANTIAAPAGRRVVVDVPSGEVRLNREFDIVEGTNAVIILDFDGEKSVTDLGNGRYRMTPVIGVMSVN
jgi:hypothetical protein